MCSIISSSMTETLMLRFSKCINGNNIDLILALKSILKHVFSRCIDFLHYITKCMMYAVNLTVNFENLKTSFLDKQIHLHTSLARNNMFHILQGILPSKKVI